MSLRPFDPDVLHALQRQRALSPGDDEATRKLIEFTQQTDNEMWMYIGATANTTDQRKIDQYAAEAKRELASLTKAGFTLRIHDGCVTVAGSPREVDWASIDDWAPDLLHVTQVSFSDDELGFDEGSADVAAQLFEREEARGLTSIDFGGTGLSAAFGSRFAEAQLPNLVELRFYWEALRMEGLTAIASNRSLTSLKHLGLTFCGYDGAPAEEGAEGGEVAFARSLGEAAFAGHLCELELRELFVGPWFVKELVQHPQLTQNLVSLDLSSEGEGWNCLGEDGVRALAKCKTFDRLTSLQLGYAEVPDRAIVHLAVGFFPALEVLQIGHPTEQWPPDVLLTLNERFSLIDY